jgi:DNA adenine methylase
MKNKPAMPVVKWVGGKRQLLDAITPLVPAHIPSYCEPFLGGGAVLFTLQPHNIIINDVNKELVNVYTVIRDNVDDLILDLKRHENTPEYFYSIRNLDRNKSIYQDLSQVQRASRILYLNKTCYNGLFRVNSSGKFNTPFGHYKNPNIVNESALRGVHNYLKSSNVSLSCQDYSLILDNLPKNTFVYLDPPYDPVSNTANFTGYDEGGFGKEEQIRLKECCDILTLHNIKFLLSNSSTEFIRELYADYHITTVQAKRSVNSVGSKRKKIDEVLIRNYN